MLKATLSKRRTYGKCSLRSLSRPDFLCGPSRFQRPREEEETGEVWLNQNSEYAGWTAIGD